jgi:hypothetical protein
MRGSHRNGTLYAYPFSVLCLVISLSSDPDILEIFSRGQNPQHWHVAKNRIGHEKNGSPIEGDVYLEIGRKEASLTDVDNVLAGIVRRYFGPEKHEDVSEMLTSLVVCTHLMTVNVRKPRIRSERKVSSIFVNR